MTRSFFGLLIPCAYRILIAARDIDDNYPGEHLCLLALLIFRQFVQLVCDGGDGGGD